LSETVVERVSDDDDYSGTFHVYQPFRAGLPRLQPYFRELWRRREFATEASAATLRAQHANTVFGQVWNVLNPLLLAIVYYLLVFIIGGGRKQGLEFFAYLLSGLFLFYFVANSMTGGAGSVTSAGKMIMNTAFPRALLPLSAVRTAFRRFIPTLFVLFVALMIGPVKLGWVTFLAVPWFLFVLMFSAGLAMLLATVQVYFRDTASFLPYITRIWLYTSPVLWYPEEVKAAFKPLEIFNPLFSLIGGWQDIVIEHKVPLTGTWVTAAAWSVSFLLVGTFFFLSRERDFAVRL
jgi:teichoic acid transport system permease protein